MRTTLPTEDPVTALYWLVSTRPAAPAIAREVPTHRNAAGVTEHAKQMSKGYLERSLR